MRTFQKIAAIAALSLVSQSATWAQLSVGHLRVEHMENPSVVDAVQPRFSWINEAKNAKVRGASQTAYQIVVASSPEQLKAGHYDVWDSGRKASAASNLVAYDGPALASGTDYYWRVRTWDGDGKVSAWSETASWGMGLLHAGDWKATWIGLDRHNDAAPLFRKTFSTSRKVSKAKAFICGLGFFELYVNGQRIGDDCLVPNLSNYTHRPDLNKAGLALNDNFRGYRVLYMAYDVTKALEQGDNAVGVVLGNGFYDPDKHIAGFYGYPCLLFQLDITYDDGSHDLVVSDGSWQTKMSAIKYNGVYQGETYDARTETPAWATTAASSAGWQPAQKVSGPAGQLTAQTSPTDKVTERLRPVSMKRMDDGRYEVDFGKEIAGWIRFSDIEGRAGDTLRVDYVCESPQGKQQYVFKGSGKESYAPRFTWFAFSKAIVSGIRQLTEANVQAEAVNTDLPITAEFETSNTLYNNINTIWQRSQMDNMHGCIASDCPHRERLPYTGDGEAACETVMFNFDAAAFYQKWIRDMRDAQDKDTGYEPNSAPWQPGCGGGVAWGAAMNTMPWEYYVHYGDRRMLEESFFAMTEQVRYMLTWMQPDGTMFQKRANVGQQQPNYWFNLGDWCPPYGLPKDDLVHTFYLWLCADYTARAAEVLGYRKEQGEYADLARRVKEAFHKKYYDGQEKTYGDFGANIYALRMGVPQERKADVVSSLRKEIVDGHNGHVHTGFLGTKFFFEVLTDNGLHDVALAAMNKKDFPSYGHWIEQGATTTWEQWDGNNSRNHPMFGSGLTWFYRRLAGINADPQDPGFRHIVIHPYVSAAVSKVRYAYETPYGTVVSDLQTQADGRHTLQVTIPVGSRASLYLPTTTVASISESGKPVENQAGILLQGTTQDCTLLSLQQGSYAFTF